jgi:hypothetical protein
MEIREYSVLAVGANLSLTTNLEIWSSRCGQGDAGITHTVLPNRHFVTITLE